MEWSACRSLRGLSIASKREYTRAPREGSTPSLPYPMVKFNKPKKTLNHSRVFLFLGTRPLVETESGGRFAWPSERTGDGLLTRLSRALADSIPILK